MPKILKKSEILGANDVSYKDVEVPEWGGAVRIKTLSVGELIRYQELITDKKGKDISENKALLYLLAFSIVDEDGNPIFTEDEVKELAKKSAAVVLRLAQEVAELNKLTESAAEEIRKN